jgi:exosortase
MVFTSWNQSIWWITLEEDHFGWLTPAFALFVIYERRERIITAWRACSAPNSSRATGFAGGFLNASAAVIFTVGLLSFLAGAAHRAGGGPSVKGTFVASFGMSLLLLALPFFTSPQPLAHGRDSTFSSPRRVGDTPHPRAPSFFRSIQSDSRLSLCALLVFPAVVWLYSEPLVSVAETEVSSHVLAPMAALVAKIFDLLGFPVSCEGNVLLMPDHGRVGVEEACSGIRSFAACVYAGAFLGAIMLKRFWQQTFLIFIAVTFALVLNFGRSLFLTSWAYAHGTTSIEGFVHDAAGYFVMGLTVAGLFLFLTLLSPKSQRPTLRRRTD